MQAAAGVQCSYFSKYGRCCRAGGECLYEHDPDKIAICLDYLHDQCSDEACPLSHEPTPQRMPVCRLFLLGLCVAPSCRYTLTLTLTLARTLALVPVHARPPRNTLT